MNGTTLRRAVDGFSFALLISSAAWAQTTTRVSVATGGTQPNGISWGPPPVSADGRYVAFVSMASNLVAGDTNAKNDVFVRDRVAGTTVRASVDSAGAQGNDHSGDWGIAMSPDGRFVAFTSAATNLVAGDTSGVWDVFVRDLFLGTTERVSVDSAGVQGDDWIIAPSISANGRYVAFSSDASNLVPDDTLGARDVFVRDRAAGTTERVSLTTLGGQATDLSAGSSISGDGRYVAFMSVAPNLVPGDTNSVGDVFVRDRTAATTERVSVDTAGAQGNAGSGYFGIAISADGRHVAFASEATNLVGVDANGYIDVFVHDRVTGTTEIVSVDSLGGQADGPSYDPVLSGDGRFVAFDSDATNLVPIDTNMGYDSFLVDRIGGTIERVTLGAVGEQGNGVSTGIMISGDARYAAFVSVATNLVPGDTNLKADVFLRDREGGPDFSILCEPGTGGIVGCPCSNAPSGPGRGCDNSAATGGATLSASGATCLSSDSLVFTTSGERPTALSVVFQGTTSIPAGLVYGQGIRCTGGALKRLYSKNAMSGSITAPNFEAGEPTVSARSAAKGDVIPPGGARRYFVAYRDPFVLGGCPSTSTFNVTTTGQVIWSP